MEFSRPLTGAELRSTFGKLPDVCSSGRATPPARIIPEIRSVQGIRDATGKQKHGKYRKKRLDPQGRKLPTASEKSVMANSVERLTLRQNGGMYPAYWDRHRENMRRERLLALSDQEAFRGELGNPKVSAENTAKLMPYLNLSTSRFTMGLTPEVQHGYALKLRYLNHGSGGLPGMGNGISECSILNDCDVGDPMTGF